MAPASVSAELQALAQALRARYGERLYLGTSSWHFPGWQAWVWQDRHPQAELSRTGLNAYAQHPLLRTVSLDRAFYRPLDAGTGAHRGVLVFELSPAPASVQALAEALLAPVD